MTEDKKSFMARIEPYVTPSDFVRVRGAYYLAKYGHRGQVRREWDDEGNPLRYFEHARRVALVMMDEVGCYDPDQICTCLLHDTGEDSEDIDLAVTELFFGKVVAYRVRLLTKVPGDTEGNLERALLTDACTTVVKCCDRTDNLRSLPDDPVFRDKQLAETYEYLTALHLQPFPDTEHLRKAKVILRNAFVRAGGDPGLIALI